MSKAVLISIHPEWCDLIASGKKTIEVRKTRPKLDTPFKCYIYQTRGDAPCEWVDGKLICKSEKCAKVIGEFVCDGIKELIPISAASSGDFCYLFASDEFKKAACMDAEELLHYGKGKTIYGWNILSAKIYDQPKFLNQFWAEKICPRGIGYTTGGDCTGCWECEKQPPQSWCYVEES